MSTAKKENKKEDEFTCNSFFDILKNLSGPLYVNNKRVGARLGGISNSATCIRRTDGSLEAFVTDTGTRTHYSTEFHGGDTQESTDYTIKTKIKLTEEARASSSFDKNIGGYRSDIVDPKGGILEQQKEVGETVCTFHPPVR